MSKKSTIKPLALAISAAFVGSLAMSSSANAGENPFAMSTISDSTSFTIAKKDGSCGEGKCGSKKKTDKKKSGSCGGDMKGKKKDGSCGGAKKGKTKDGSCGGAKKGKTKDGSCGGKK